MLDIPLPEDDEMSDDEFDGYIDTDDLTAADDDGPLDGDRRDIDDSPVDIGIPVLPDFQQPTGPALDMVDKSPLDFFKLLVTDDMLDHVVEQTNINSTSVAQIYRHTRVHGWSKKPHDRAELQKFLAMTITMGLVNYPHMEDYWSTSWPYATPTVLPGKRANFFNSLFFVVKTASIYL